MQCISKPPLRNSTAGLIPEDMHADRLTTVDADTPGTKGRCFSRERRRSARKRAAIPAGSSASSPSAFTSEQEPLSAEAVDDRDAQHAEPILDRVGAGSSRISRPATAVTGAVHVMGAPPEIQVRAFESQRPGFRQRHFGAEPGHATAR